MGGLDPEGATSSVEVESNEIGQSNEVPWKEYSASVHISEEKKR